MSQFASSIKFKNVWLPRAGTRRVALITYSSFLAIESKQILHRVPKSHVRTRKYIELFVTLKICLYFSSQPHAQREKYLKQYRMKFLKRKKKLFTIKCRLIFIVKNFHCFLQIQYILMKLLILPASFRFLRYSPSLS